eukprot:scaffold1983_cov376-Prasinococcus_capsulatus_cf.AAC.2
MLRVAHDRCVPVAYTIGALSSMRGCPLAYRLTRRWELVAEQDEHRHGVRRQRGVRGGRAMGEEELLAAGALQQRPLPRQPPQPPQHQRSDDEDDSSYMGRARGMTTKLRAMCCSGAHHVLGALRAGAAQLQAPLVVHARVLVVPCTHPAMTEPLLSDGSDNAYEQPCEQARG